MIPEKVIKEREFLRKICKSCSEAKRKKILQTATKQQIEVLAEICKNLTRGNLKLTKPQLRKLQNHAPFVRTLGRQRTFNGARRVIQKGGGFPFVPILIPLLLEIARRVVP
jgi:hypothetical protein